MANWAGPVHLPKFTKEEFDEKKRKYNEKYGYTVTVPAFKDIIHLFPFPPMTEKETALWKARKYDEIPADRREQIRDEKARKKAKFLAMMGSPSPKILRSAGAILTALDDLQDAVSTLACIGMITAAVVGGTTAAVLAGPLGWILGASTALRIINPFSRLKGPKWRSYTGKHGKIDWEDTNKKNPFSKRARVTAAKNIKNFSPKMGNWVEALQVTDNIWGVGLCLGPIVGFIQDTICGRVRMEMGQKVDIKLSPGWKPKHLLTASNAMRAATCMHGYPWKSYFMDEVYCFIGANLAQQVLAPYLEEYNPSFNSILV